MPARSAAATVLRRAKTAASENSGNRKRPGQSHGNCCRHDDKPGHKPKSAYVRHAIISKMLNAARYGDVVARLKHHQSI